VLDANVENLELVGAAATNGKGNALNNILSGNAAGNVLTGMEGSDTLYGAGGDDTLGGGEGVDALYGGLGRDALSGGAGADYFCFETALNAATNVDRISDFSVADDTVALRASTFGYLGVFDGQLGLDAKHFRSGAAAADAGDRIIHNRATGSILFDSDGVGGAAAVQFASVTAGLVLTNEDFFVF
jgi:Ca2+-binding RTX toxin-like protein